MKIYIVKGVSFDKEKSDQMMQSVETYLGYYTNLKEIYKKLDSKTIQAYSTVASKIRENGIYQTYYVKLYVNYRWVLLHQLIIEQVHSNEISSRYGYIDLNELIAKEFSDFKYNSN